MNPIQAINDLLGQAYKYSKVTWIFMSFALTIPFIAVLLVIAIWKENGFHWDTLLIILVGIVGSWMLMQKLIKDLKEEVSRTLKAKYPCRHCEGTGFFVCRDCVGEGYDRKKAKKGEDP